jgi:hypothetical protein
LRSLRSSLRLCVKPLVILNPFFHRLSAFPGSQVKVMVTLHHPILLPPSVMLKPDLRTPIGPA